MDSIVVKKWRKMNGNLQDGSNSVFIIAIKRNSLRLSGSVTTLKDLKKKKTLKDLKKKKTLKNWKRKEKRKRKRKIERQY